MYMIKEIPITDRPRERLVKQGVKSLSNDEIMAILLRTGSKNISVIELSKQVLYHLEKFTDLNKITYHELIRIKGIKHVKAVTILAAIELSKRLIDNNINEFNSYIKSPKNVYELIKNDFLNLEQEHLICIFLDLRGKVIKKELVYIGTSNQITINPKEIFKHAIKVSASAIILSHNHLTGNSSPSNADVVATNNLIKAGELMDIDVLDHIIIGKSEYFSIKENKKYLNK